MESKRYFKWTDLLEWSIKTTHTHTHTKVLSTQPLTLPRVNESVILPDQENYIIISKQEEIGKLGEKRSREECEESKQEKNEKKNMQNGWKKKYIQCVWCHRNEHYMTTISFMPQAIFRHWAEDHLRGKINSHYTVLISMTILFISTNALFTTLYPT